MLVQYLSVCLDVRLLVDMLRAVDRMMELGDREMFMKQCVELDVMGVLERVSRHPNTNVYRLCCEINDKIEAFAKETVNEATEIFII